MAAKTERRIETLLLLSLGVIALQVLLYAVCEGRGILEGSCGPALTIVKLAALTGIATLSAIVALRYVRAPSA